LKQLLANLLVNALKYGEPDAPVQVVARSDSASFELRVTNRGAPIPEDVRVRLFEPYYRGTGAATRAEGLGLGLYIVAEIARGHGGTMSVNSGDGEVSFVFRMPQAPAA
jgi:signal transduction histidine kinase